MKKIKYLLEKVPFFLITVPLFIVIHIEKDYRELINYQFVYSEILQLFIAPFICYLLSCLVFRNQQKRLLFCFVLILIFFFFADVKDTLFKSFNESFISRYSFLLPAIVLIIILSFLIIRRRQPPFNRIFFFINSLFLLFIVTDIVSLPFANVSKLKNDTYHDSNLVEKYLPSGAAIKPDIYYLVFDSYTSSATLRSDFNYDNSRTDSFLLNKGFYIARNATSNYNFTVHSIGSSLNISYLKKVTPYKKIYLKDYLYVIAGIYDNNLFPILEKEGYTIINHSIFDFKNHPSTIPHYNVWRLDFLYSRHNILKKINLEIGWMFRKNFAWLLPANNQYENYSIAKQVHDSLSIEALEKTVLEKIDKPRFVYLHIETPHAPYVLDSTGQRHAKRSWPLPLEVEKNDYVSQLAYSNTFIQKIVTSIFEKNNRPFVIILQGDHGFRFNDGPVERKKEFNVMSAVYFPDKDYHSLNDSMNNINTFRIVLNKSFNQNFNLLKDSSIYIDY